MPAFFNNGFVEYHLFDYWLKAFETDRPTMRRLVIQEAKKIKPDLVFCQVQGSDVLDLETFQTLSKIAFTVNFTFDIRTKEQTEWLYNLAPVLGLICFSNQRDVEECKARGFENVMCLQSAADEKTYIPVGEYSIQGFGKVFDGRSGVVFIGNNYVNTNIEFPLSKEREQMVNLLKYEFGDQFNVYGNNWDGSKLIMQKEEIEIYQRAMIGVNQNNYDEELYCSDRIWRMMSCGVLCLAKYFKGIENIFTRYEHLDWWETLDELQDTIKYYLDNPTKAQQIATKGMQHVRENHSWSARIKEMMAFVSTIRKEPEMDGCTKVGGHAIDGAIPGPFDQQFDGRVCDCAKMRYEWTECGCVLKEWQLRVHQNI